MEPAVIAASIAAGAGLISAVVAFFSGRSTRKAVERQRTEDYRTRQLNELYGPMHMLRRESRRLHDQLPSSPDDGWRLIAHIEEIKNEPDERRRMVVRRILDINEQLHELIVGKGGLLVSFPAPESFETFLTHASTLRQHWDRGVNVTNPVSYVPFPPTLSVVTLERTCLIAESMSSSNSPWCRRTSGFILMGRGGNRWHVTTTETLELSLQPLG